MIRKIEEALREMLADPSPAVRDAAAASLDRIRARRSVAEFREGLRTGTLEEKVRIVFAAGEIGGAEGQEILLAALEDGSPEVRGAAVRTLESLPGAAVLRALAARLPKERGVVLGNLLEALGKSRRKELAPVVERYLDHPEPEVRARALLAFARVAEGEGLEKVLRHAADPSETVRAAVSAAVGEWPAR